MTFNQERISRGGDPSIMSEPEGVCGSMIDLS